MSSVSPTKAQVFQLFQRHEKQLVTAMSSTDLLKLSNNLLKNVVISKEMRDTFASLDHDGLDSELRARYLLRHVLQRIECGSVMYNNLVRALYGAGGCVRQVVWIISEELARDSNTADPNVTMTLHSDDVPILITCLIQCSHKWEELGIAVGLPTHARIECGNAPSNKIKLCNVLSNWLTAAYPHAKKPTLTSLKMALASDLVEEGRLASNLEEIYREAVRSALGGLPETTEQDSIYFQLTHQSSDTTVTDHKSALLEIHASPSESVSYQWMKDGRPLSECSDFSGTCTEILLINQASLGAEGEYYCQVSCDSKQLTSTPATITVTYPPDKECLISLYSSLYEVPDDSWPLANAKTFIDLVLVRTNRSQHKYTNVFIEEEMEALLGDKERVGYKDAFSQYESRALVLVEGRPGSGKTTLANRIAKDWAEGKVLKNTDRVFLISLRNDHSKSDLFKMLYHSQSEEFMLNVEQSNGEKTCFILDGYDEFSSKDNDSSIIYQLINKTYLPRAMIIITSRPIATVKLRHKATTTIESLGFTKDHFDLYVNSYPFEDANDTNEAESTKSKLRKHLKACTNVLNMCYLPINASIICFLFNQGLDDSELPKTETQLYEKLVISIILRKLQPFDNFHSLNDLRGENKECFSRLCSLALDMMVENKQVIHQLPVPLESLNETPFRGLLATDRTDKYYGLKDVFTFLHHTLQEYLAAYYLASLDENQQTEIIRLNSGQDHMLTTFKFYCGLVNFENKISQFTDITTTEANALFLVHCTYENQQPELCRGALKILDGEISISPCTLTPADFTALSYVISNASHLVSGIHMSECQLYEESLNEIWEIQKLNERDFFHHGIESFNSGMAEIGNVVNFVRSTQVSYKRNRQCYQMSSGLSKYFRYMKYYRDSADDYTRYMSKFKKNKEKNSSPYPVVLNSTSAEPFVQALTQCSNLQKIYVIDNFSSVGSAEIIARLLRNNASSIKNLTIINGLTSASAAELANGLKCCNHLEILTLEDNYLNFEGAAALSEGLRNCKRLHTLVLDISRIGPKGAMALAHGIKTLPLQELSLSHSSIGHEGTLALAKEGCFKNLKKLDLSGNVIGMTAISSELKNLSHLILSGNCIDATGTAALVEGCFNLEQLDLSANPIGSAGAAALRDCLYYCFNLQFLKIRNCDVTSDGIKALVDGFSRWRRLRFLDLTGNTLCEGMSDLAIGIKYLRFLEHLYLAHNQIDWRGAQLLAKGLKSCPMLTVLNISHNNIGSIGATAIADGLICTNIKFVNLSHNSFGPGNEVLLASIVNLARRGHPEMLDLAHNDMGTDSTVCLIIHLIFCNYPMKLNLSANNTSPEVSQFLTDLKEIPIKLTVHLKTDPLQEKN